MTTERLNKSLRACLPTLAVLVTNMPALADGIPFDPTSGSVTVPHHIVCLSEAQKLEATEKRQVTLTDTQLAMFRARCPRFPHTIPEVYSHRHEDCTCLAAHPYAILLPSETAIAVPVDEVEHVSRYGVSTRADVFRKLLAQPEPKRPFWSRVSWFFHLSSAKRSGR